jgi:hypothetical protein
MRITESVYIKALKESKNDPLINADFNGIIKEETGRVSWYQVDTKDFEYVSQHVSQYRVYYTGSK